MIAAFPQDARVRNAKIAEQTKLVDSLFSAPPFSSLYNLRYDLFALFSEVGLLHFICDSFGCCFLLGRVVEDRGTVFCLSDIPVS